MTHTDQQFMKRCFDLARLGAGAVSPNPMVGAVLEYQGRILGEGWHQHYGEAHAEVHALRSVAVSDRRLLPYSTLYCSLEPCSHYGKTPPCTDLILEHKIPRVVVCNVDPNPLVGGQGLHKLRAAGVQVTQGLLEADGRYLNRAFFTWICKKRPYVILKWAQSADGFLGRRGERTAISGPAAQRLVHRWRSESDAILVGTTTALTDNPRLDNRLFPGRTPLRIALDFSGKIPATAHLLDDTLPTRIIGPVRQAPFQQTHFTNVPAGQWIPALLQQLQAENRAILLVEGGAEIHRQFIAQDVWDEIRVIKGLQRLGAGVPVADIPPNAQIREYWQMGTDFIRIFTRNH